MYLNTSYHGACPVPFYDATLFPQGGGYIAGRLCASSEFLPGNPTCCLPCPATYWTFPDSFSTYNTVAAWLNVAGLILNLFLLMSYIFLPVQKSRSHYLSVTLIVAVSFLNLGFIVPLGAQPEQCYNGITPNDMHSSLTCAWSGAFIVAGGMCGATWIFIRALSMHLQICWNIVPGRKFFYISQAMGWGVPAVLFTATMTVTGVSFRFGNSCHVNHDGSMQTFWGWLLGISAMAVFLQLATFGYCIHVFITNLWSEKPSPPSPLQSSGSMAHNDSNNDNNTSDLPIHTASIRTQTAKVIWRRLKSVLFLQWRGILIVTITLVDVIFFAVVFVYLDDLEHSLAANYGRADPWLTCLMINKGDKNKCLDLANKLIVKESIVGAVMVMLSLISIELFFLLVRWSLLSGWKDLLTRHFRSLVKHHREFVSLDANTLASPPPPPPLRSGSVFKIGGTKGGVSVAFEMQSPIIKDYNIINIDNNNNNNRNNQDSTSCSTTTTSVTGGYEHDTKTFATPTMSEIMMTDSPPPRYMESFSHSPSSSSSSSPSSLSHCPKNTVVTKDSPTATATATDNDNDKIHSRTVSTTSSSFQHQHQQQQQQQQKKKNSFSEPRRVQSYLYRHHHHHHHRHQRGDDEEEEEGEEEDDNDNDATTAQNMGWDPTSSFASSMPTVMTPTTTTTISGALSPHRQRHQDEHGAFLPGQAL